MYHIHIHSDHIHIHIHSDHMIIFMNMYHIHIHSDHIQPAEFRIIFSRIHIHIHMNMIDHIHQPNVVVMEPNVTL